MGLINKGCRAGVCISHFDFAIEQTFNGKYGLFLRVPTFPRDYVFHQNGFSTPHDALSAAVLAEKILDCAEIDSGSRQGMTTMQDETASENFLEEVSNLCMAIREQKKSER